LRTAAGISWFVVIVAELVGAQSGLGYLVEESRLSFDLNRAVCAMVLIGVSGLLLQAAVSLLTFGLTRREPLDD
jgi:NitT/TauT family transport system permease protein/sulfonate transport system permease protein